MPTKLNGKTKITTETRSPAHNRRLAQWRVRVIENSTSHQLLWCIESLVLKIPAFGNTQTVSCDFKKTTLTE